MTAYELVFFLLSIGTLSFAREVAIVHTNIAMIFENTLTFATLFSTLASLARSTCLEPPSTPDCSYQFFHGRWVCHSNTLKDNYIEAQSHCESFGGKLATINNKWDFKSVNEIHRIHGSEYQFVMQASHRFRSVIRTCQCVN
ncbi:hypothetical protein TCAL_15677 [Tigriopus californicus]|uniref:C-type lectin domain-containing protein n=1 Tax=Tigriopus californicus TaxID=6832 RepID=A0A553PA73_TIGCA|nr:hypothetical protein TCAL_15677 [Tigriopus californicus]